MSKKLEYRCATGNFPVYKGTTFVLRIRLLNSVSVRVPFMIYPASNTGVTLIRLRFIKIGADR